MIYLNEEEDIQNLNFKDLKIGQQFIILNERDKKLQTFDFNIYFLKSIICNRIFVFSKDVIDIYQYDDFEEDNIFANDGNEVDYDSCDESIITKKLDINISTKDCYNLIYLLLDDNHVLKINGYIGWYYDSNEYKNLFINFAKINSDKRVMYEKSSFVDNDELIIVFKLRYKLDDDSCIIISSINRINQKKYEWKRMVETYVFNKCNDFLKSVEINYPVGQLISELINMCNDESDIELINYFNTLLFNTHIGRIQYFIEYPEYFQKFCSYFENIDGLNKDYIQSHCKPIYENQNTGCKGYIKSLYDSSDVYLSLEDYSKIDKRKARAILDYNKNDATIDIYTGEIIDKVSTYEIVYSDFGGEIIEDNNPRAYSIKTYAFTKIDDMFIEATDEEKAEIIDRKKMLSIMEDNQ